MNSCLPEKAQYPVTGSMMKRTAVTRTAQYPVTFGSDSYFLCTCTMSMPRIYEFIELYCTVFYSNPQDGGGGQFFFQFRASPLGSDLPEFFLYFGDFLLQLLRRNQDPIHCIFQLFL